MSEVLSQEQLSALLIEQSFGDEVWTAETALKIGRWIAHGDGCAIYRNEDLGHPDIGMCQFVSFGSELAQLEVPEPPEQLPDIGGAINWRYRLFAVVR